MRTWILALAACGHSTGNVEPTNANREWTKRPLERVSAVSTMLAGDAHYTIALPHGLMMRGSEGASIWESQGDPVVFHVQVSYDHAAANLDEAVAKYGDPSVVDRAQTADGFQFVRETPASIWVVRTVPFDGGALVCEAGLSRTDSTALADPGAIAWLEQAICGSVRPG
jgi:hypothetical protein